MELDYTWFWFYHGYSCYDSHKTKYSTIAIILYAGSMLFLYFVSTAYHYIINAERKSKVRILDHIGIYLLIAGTYAPVTLIILVDSKGILLFTLVWSIAIIGALLKLFFTGRFQVFSVILYVVMGWLIILDIDVLVDKIGANGIDYFYALKKIKFTHVIWHVFVLLGSFFHFLMIRYYVI